MTYTRGYLQLPHALCNKPCGVCMLCKCCELEIDENCKCVETPTLINKCKSLYTKSNSGKKTQVASSNIVKSRSNDTKKRSRNV
jgi:hypothetical protein